MDVLLLSRLQFTATTIFHFFFVPLTLGLSVLVAIMETQYARTGNETYLKMTRFWGKLFLINFAVGVVTGITLEFQFGTNWSGIRPTWATSSARFWPSKPPRPFSWSPR